MAATFVVGKVTAISVAKKGLKHYTIRKVYHDIVQVEKEATAFLVACYGSKLKCDSMTECHQCMWAQKTGMSTTCMPPNSVLSHRQWHHLSRMCCGAIIRYGVWYGVPHWYGVLESDPPLLNPVEFGWEADHANKALLPHTVHGGSTPGP